MEWIGLDWMEGLHMEGERSMHGLRYSIDRIDMLLSHLLYECFCWYGRLLTLLPYLNFNIHTNLSTFRARHISPRPLYL